MVCEANSKKFSGYLNYSKINYFISWTMFMWFCTSPGQNYLYFKSGSTDGDSKTLAVFAIITSIFGWFYFATSPGNLGKITAEPWACCCLNHSWPVPLRTQGFIGGRISHDSLNLNKYRTGVLVAFGCVIIA